MFIHRFCSMIVLLALLTLTLFNNFAGMAAFTVFGVLLSFFLTKEICEMLANIGIQSHKKFLCVINAVLFFLPQFGLTFLFRIGGLCAGLFILLIFVLFIIFLFAILKSVNSKEKLKKILASCSILVLVSFPVGLITMIHHISTLSYSGYFCGKFLSLFLYFILVTKSGDIGAYVTGSLSNKLMKGGNHKMIPSVSPGKSYEGLCGGIAFSIGISFAVIKICGMNVSWGFALVGGIVLYFAGMIGDLVESSMKRTCKVKDSGRTIPGIGGVYDLLDSLMLAAPVFVIFLYTASILPFFR